MLTDNDAKLKVESEGSLRSCIKYFDGSFGHCLSSSKPQRLEFFPSSGDDKAWNPGWSAWKNCSKTLDGFRNPTVYREI
jgi:hypothetical protein